MPAQAKRAPRPDFTIATDQPLPPAAPAFGALAIGDLKSDFQCRYICTAEGEPARYCGRPTAPRPSRRHSSWCSEHLPIVFNLQLSVGRIPPKKGRV